MYVSQNPPDMVYLFAYMTLNSKAIKQKIVVIDTTQFWSLLNIKSLKLDSVLQMSSLGITTFASFS